MEDIFDTPALRVLRKMAKEGPLKMRDFVYTTGHAPRMAKILRDKLEAEGYLAVSEEPSKPVSNDIEISITADGRKLAELSFAQEELTDRIKRKRSDKRA